MLKKVILWILVILNCCAIFCFSSEIGTASNEKSEILTQKVENIVTEISEKEPSDERFDNINHFIRKQGHFIEFAFLGIFVFLLARSYNISLKNSLLISLTFVLFYAITDEIHQLFVEGRNGCVKDVFIDFFGSIIGIGITYPIEVKKLKKQTKKL